MRMRSTPFYLLAISICFIFSSTFAQNYDWVRGSGGGSFDLANDLAADDAGNSYITGWFQDTAWFDGNPYIAPGGGQDFYVAKYDPAGNLEWLRTGGGAGNDQGYGLDIDAAGNVYVAGSFEGPCTWGGTTLNGYGMFDIFIAKYDANGNLQWVKEAGSSNSDQANDLKVSPTGMIYISGNIGEAATFGGQVTGFYGVFDVFVAKYDASGNPIWASNCGSSVYDNCYGMALDANSNIYITGPYQGAGTYGGQSLAYTGQDDDIYLVKFDSAGTGVWTQNMGGSDQEQGNFVGLDKNGVPYVTGYFTSTSINFGTFPLTGSGSSTAFLASYNPANGTVLSAVAYASSGSSQGSGWVEDGQGNTFLLGQFNGTMTAGGQTIVSNNPSFGWDVFLVKWDAQGTGLWALNGGSSGFWDTPNGIDKDANNNIFFGGAYQGSAVFGNDTLSPWGSADIFVAKILPDSVVIAVDAAEGTELTIYPNTVRDELRLVIPKGLEGAKLRMKILDMQGRTVLAKEISLGTRNTWIGTENVAPGMYILAVSDGSREIVKRFVVEK